MYYLTLVSSALPLHWGWVRGDRRVTYITQGYSKNGGAFSCPDSGWMGTVKSLINDPIISSL